MKPYRVLSWGVGVQSTALAVMSALGDLDPLDLVITADTGWERAVTYEARDFYRAWLQARGLRVEIVNGGNIRDTQIGDHMNIPAWTMTGAPLKRQCTREYKIRPIRRRVREILGFPPSHPPAPGAGAVETWLGISLDEWQRAKPARVSYVVNRWPLLEERIAREACRSYLEERDLPVPARSACVCCPFRKASEWLIMRREAPGEFQEAVEFDEKIRYGRQSDVITSDQIYLWNGLEPLGDADLEKAASRERLGKQLPLMCESGYCMV